jgi:general secretion pathway protein H
MRSARTLQRTCRAARNRGISLLELLVAIAILAVVTTGAALAIANAGTERRLEREGRRMAALVELACERAQITGREHGVHFSRAGYAFGFATPAGWRVLHEGELRPRLLDSGMVLAASRDDLPLELDAGTPLEPQVVCLASGELTPFEATLGLAGASLAVRGLPDATVAVEVPAP